MNKSDYPGPTSHRTLRALLRTIERAYKQKDIEALHDAYDLTDSSTQDYDEIVEYINGLSERLRNGEYKSYFMYTDDDVAAMKTDLEMLAYGDFDEAMLQLEYDLRSIDRYRGDDELESQVFRPELFADEDRTKWNELWAITMACLDAPGDSEENGLVSGAIAKLRSYQQKSHGPLVPTLTATYRRENEGVSVRLAWDDQCLYVETHAPFIVELDEYFINTAPINGIADFTPKCFPERFGEYKLGCVDSANLFKYEL
jgi:hypothetical protein